MTDREKVVKEFELFIKEFHPACASEGVELDMLREVLALLKEQEEKAGKWIPVINGRGGMECSICHDYAPSYQSCAEYLSKYCPNCGAKMEGR